MRNSIFVLTFFLSILNGYAQSKIDSLKTTLEQTSNREVRLKVLDTLTRELIRSNSDEQKVYLERYIKLAQDLKEYDLMASKSRFLIQDYIYRGQSEKARQVCDSLLKFKPYFKKENSEAHLLLKRAATFYTEEKFSAARKDYADSYQLFIKSGDSIFAADALLFNAQVNVDINEFVAAIENYEKAGKLYEILGDDQYALLVGAELTSLYNINGFVEKSIQERERLLQKARENEDYNTYMLLLGQNMNAYSKLGDLEKVRALLDEMIQLKNKELDESWKGYYSLFILNNELLYAVKTESLKEAEVLMAQMNEMTKTKEVPDYIEPDVLDAKATYFEAIGNEEALIPILEKLVEKETRTNISVQLKSRQKLADIYKTRGQYSDALRLYETNTKVKDSIYTAQKANAFLYYQTEFETERRQRELVEQDSEIERLESEQALAESKRNMLVVIIFSLVLLALAIWWFGKNRRKQLAEKLKQRKEELNTFTHQLLQKSKEQAELQEQFDKIKNSLETTDTVDEFQELLSAKILTSDDWYNFKEKFLKVHPYFFSRINDKGYKLTKSEERLIALEKLGLDNKEIANMLGVSVDSIFNNRYRLRKKLNAPNEISLLEFFEKAS